MDIHEPSARPGTEHSGEGDFSEPVGGTGSWDGSTCYTGLGDRVPFPWVSGCVVKVCLHEVEISRGF